MNIKNLTNEELVNMLLLTMVPGVGRSFTHDELRTEVLERMTEWVSIETAPKDSSAFLITTAGPQVDLCWWDHTSHCFRDYYHKQEITRQWPYMVAWQRLPKPADVMKFKPE
jgi:hypothetical protein